jgi:hypothetical protein
MSLRACSPKNESRSTKGHMTTRRVPFTLTPASAILAGIALTICPSSRAEPPSPGVIETYGKLPLSFEANRGQTDYHVKFLSRGHGYALFLTHDEAVLSIKTPEKCAAVRMRLVGSNPKATVNGQAELPGKSNYFLGNDPAKWRTDIPTYAKVRYEKVYQGVDLVYYGNQGQLEYDFVVAPESDPGRISLTLNGPIQVDTDGDLIIATKAGDVRFKRPVAYQVSALGAKNLVDAGYALERGNRFGFRVAEYDHSKPLIIDPVLSYSTYLGGNDTDIRLGMAVDAAGDVFLTGETLSTNFPVVNAQQGVNNGSYDAFVTKINAGGASIAYSTYLGGSAQDAGYGIAVDGAGNAYVGGTTFSPNFPLVNPFQTTFSVTGYTAFVTKINSTGGALLYSTYLGGSGSQFGTAITVDGAGAAYLAGNTTSSDFPLVNPIQASLGPSGFYHGFVSKLNAAGSALVFSTFLGGNSSDQPQGIAVDDNLNTYVTGFTSSTNFPTANPIQGSNKGGNDAFLTKINAPGSALVYSTYLGGSGNDSATGIALDASGNVYLSGFTTSTDFPTMNPLQAAYAGNTDAFVTKVNAAGSALVYSTYLGGSGAESLYYPSSIAVDPAGNAYVAGVTYSTDFPTVSPTQTANAGNGDAFVTKLNATGTALVYSSYLGGSGSEDNSGVGASIGVDSTGNIYIYGETNSTDFPTVNPLQSANAGGWDLFLTKISSAAILSATKLTFPKQVVGTTSAAGSVTLTNIGSSAMTINSVSSSDPAEFSPAGCGGSLPTGANCEISVTFTPSATGTRTARISIGDSELNSPQTIGVAGTGTDISLTPAHVSFPSEPVGTTSAPKYVTLKNVGSSPVTITGITLAGADPMDFSEKNSCGSTIAGGATCNIAIKFTPTATGPRTATLDVADNGGGSPQTVILTGTGT